MTRSHLPVTLSIEILTKEFIPVITQKQRSVSRDESKTNSFFWNHGIIRILI